MHNLVVISGPTASGKSHLASILTQSVIINADSMQLYKELPILTAQPQGLKEDPKKYDLYSVLNYRDHCSAGKWVELARNAINHAIASGKRAVVVGGTGLYIKSLLYGIALIPDIDSTIRTHVREQFANLGKDAFYQLLSKKDPKILGKVLAGDSHRMMRAMEVFEQTGKSITEFKTESKPAYKDYFHLCLMPERKFLYDNCNSRFENMIKDGAIEEVMNSRMQVNQNITLSKAIGFMEISSYLDGKMSLDKVKEKAQQATRNYAKRQLTWLRNQVRNAVMLNFSSISDLERQACKNLL